MLFTVLEAQSDCIQPFLYINIQKTIFSTLARPYAPDTLWLKHWATRALWAKLRHHAHSQSHIGKDELPFLENARELESFAVCNSNAALFRQGLSKEESEASCEAWDSRL